MLLRLYNYTGSPVLLDKSDLLQSPTANVRTLEGYCRESFNIENPSILIEDNSLLSDYNYMYIREYDHYYFIDPPVPERTGLYRINGHVDVLMTYKSEIKSLSGIVGRNQNEYNRMLIDERLKFLGFKVINTIAFPNSMKEGECYMLAVNGK